MQPTTVVTHTVRVLACQTVDLDAQRGLQAAVRSMPPTLAASMLAGYRGALIDVDVLTTRRRTIARSSPRGTVHAVVVAGPVTPGQATYFLSNTAPTPCASFIPGARLVFDDAEPCCDGDPGAPCVYVAMGIVRRAAPTSTP